MISPYMDEEEKDIAYGRKNMSNTNTLERIEYICITLFYAGLFMISYRSLIFQNIYGVTYRDSKAILWCLVIILVIVGIGVSLIHQRNIVNVVTNIAIPYGIFTILIYYDYKKTFIHITGLLAIVFFVLCCIQIFKRKLKSKNKKRVFLKKMRLCFWGLREIMAGEMLILMGSIAACTLFDGTLLEASVNAVSGTEKEEKQTIANNIETLLLLQEDEWENLDIEEKLDILQVVANIEADYLGIPNELCVEAGFLKDNVTGCYNDRTHRIIISFDVLNNERPNALLELVCHEAFHGFSWRLVELYDATKEELQDLKIFDEIVFYKEEFENYSDGTGENYEAYYYQRCEQDARNYAQNAVEEYYRRINDYLLEKGS